MGFQVLLMYILLFKHIISYKQCIEHNKKLRLMFAITHNSNIIYYDRPVCPALRDHKVFTKRTALYLNYPKLSYHVFTSLASLFAGKTDDLKNHHHRPSPFTHHQI